MLIIFESQYLWYFIINDDVYELLTTKLLHQRKLRCMVSIPRGVPANMCFPSGIERPVAQTWFAGGIHACCHKMVGKYQDRDREGYHARMPSDTHALSTEL